MARGPIYKIASEMADKDLYNQLMEAIDHLGGTMVPTRTITKARSTVGYGVDKSQRSIAADSVISIAKQIKARPGW